MKKFFMMMISCTILASFSGCDTGIKTLKREPAAAGQTAASAGGRVLVSAGTGQIAMIEASDKNAKYPLYVPYSEIEKGVYADKNIELLNQPFLIAETELTNEAALMILQWAKSSGKLSSNPKDHNAVNEKWVKYGGQFLIHLADKKSDIEYSPAKGTFSVKPGKEKYPFTQINWFGAVMICNWLTEMTDGNTNELVYSGMGEKWDNYGTKSNLKKKGFRLPENGEVIFASRCIGSKKPARGSLAKEYIAANVNGGMNILTPGLYWLPGRYVSGAVEPYSNAAEALRVAVPRSEAPKPVATKEKNALGLYDMGGNVDEWMNGFRDLCGHNFRELDGGTDLERLQSGHKDYQSAAATGHLLGMRLAKTR